MLFNEEPGEDFSRIIDNVKNWKDDAEFFDAIVNENPEIEEVVSGVALLVRQSIYIYGFKNVDEKWVDTIARAVFIHLARMYLIGVERGKRIEWLNKTFGEQK